MVIATGVPVIGISFKVLGNGPRAGKSEIRIRYMLNQKKRYYLGIFPNNGGGGLPKSQNFCKFTKYFFVCQIHSEVLKHVLQRGGGDI